MKSRSVALLATVSAVALSMTACGSNSLSNDPAPGAAPASTQVKVNEALAAKLPERIKSSKKVVVGVDATYAPNQFLDADGKTVIGEEVELFNAVMAKVGVTTEWRPSEFEGIITGVQGKKFDAAVSSLTINAKRMEQVNMVSYYNAGTSWATAKGNPKGLDPENACGKTVSVQIGTVQQEEDLPKRQEKCGENKINILPYASQQEATAAVVAGKADAMLADSPITAYAIKKSDGKLEQVGQMYDAAPYGFVVPKEETEFAQVIAEATKELKADGTYDAILKKWGTEAGAVNEFTVNPQV